MVIEHRKNTRKNYEYRALVRAQQPLVPPILHPPPRPCKAPPIAKVGRPLLPQLHLSEHCVSR